MLDSITTLRPARHCDHGAGSRFHSNVQRVTAFSALLLAGSSPAQDEPERAQAEPRRNQAQLVDKEGVVDHQKPGGTWSEALQTAWIELRDRLRTGELSRAAVRLSDLSLIRMDELTTITIKPPREVRPRPIIDLDQGATYFFSRERGGEVDVRTPVVNGSLRGTEFHTLVKADGTTVMTVYEGEVFLENQFGTLNLAAGEQGTVDPGAAPRRTAVIDAPSIIQWCLYYPAVIDPSELDLSAQERTVLRDVLDLYRTGDLLGALEAWPENFEPAGGAARVYQAALVLSVGETELARLLIKDLPEDDRWRILLEEILALARGDQVPQGAAPSTASGWIAVSYAAQARADLRAAREAALRAVELAPDFGFAWARLSELDFSFGDVRQARARLKTALALSPRHAQAWTLEGFMALAEGDWESADSAFAAALQVDPALSNAWLGRGLLLLNRSSPVVCRGPFAALLRVMPFRDLWTSQPGLQSALSDLATAATVEPLRSFPRSYLGKAFMLEGNFERAAREFEQARRLDPNDPTPDFYSALMYQRQNRLGAAVRALEGSVELNDNRRIYRSQFLLDQDRSVRQANLAAIYRGAGMDQYSLRTAHRGVQSDYLNASAHLFLASSYDAIRDPRRLQLRYESAWLNELLLANLLSPPGSGVLSRTVSNQEYSALVAGQEPILRINSTLNSNGDSFFEGTLVERWNSGSLALEWSRLDDNGERPNEDVDRSEIYLTIKQALSSRTTGFLQMKFQDYESGDLFRYADSSNASNTYRYSEDQDPLIWAGVAHRWSTRHTSLTLVGHLDNESSSSARNWSQRSHCRSPSGDIAPCSPFSDNTLVPVKVDYRNEDTFQIDSIEHQHIIQGDHGFLLLGGRYQYGDVQGTTDLKISDSDPYSVLTLNPVDAVISESYRRGTLYAYGSLDVTDSFSLLGGLTWEDILMPRNFQFRPLAEGTRSSNGLYPKGGFRWRMPGGVNLQGSAAQGINGISFENSLRLEPAQFGGFAQTWRSLVPDSIAPLSGADYTLMGISADGRFGDNTYWQASYLWQRAQARQQVGTLDLMANTQTNMLEFFPLQSVDDWDYRESTLRLSMTHLMGDWVSLGLDASWSVATLERNSLDSGNVDGLRIDAESDLWDVTGFVRFSHPSGWFGRIEGRFISQGNTGHTSGPADESFWQANAWIGYQWQEPFVEASVGFVNITNQDFELNPLNYLSEPPRSFQLVCQVKAAF